KILCLFFSSRRRHTRSVSAFLLNRSSDLLWLKLVKDFLPPSPTKSSNLSETAEVPACNVPSRSPLPALAIAPETKLGTASSGLRSEERRVGKECSARGAAEQVKKEKDEKC